MKPLKFVLTRTVKNAVLDTFRRPAKLITYTVVAVLIFLSAILNLSGRAVTVENGYLDKRYLDGIYMVLLSMIGIPLMLNGLKSGTTFFSMSDVNMMFVSPIKPKRILVYGLAKNAAMVFLVIICYLTYGKIAMMTFNISGFQAMMLIVGLAVFLALVQVYTLVIYSTSNGNSKRIGIIKFFVYACLIAMVLIVSGYVLINGVNLENICRALSLRVLEFIPVIGWVKGAIFSINNGDLIMSAIYLGLLGISVAICCVVFFFRDVDYYEDVLKNTETTYELRRSMKEGKVSLMDKRGKTKLHGVGINHGHGASAFFFKHMREASRRSRMIFINIQSFVIIGVAILSALLMKNFSMSSGTHIMSYKLTMASSCMLCIYIQFFMNAYADWNKELEKPYIYIVPASPLAKLICASSLGIIKPIIDGFLAFMLTGLIIGADPLTSVICSLLYGSFGFVFTTTNIITDRLLDNVKSRGILVMLYVLIIAIQTLPSIVLAVIMLVFVRFSNLALLAVPVIVWNVVTSIIVYIACKNILHNMNKG